MTHACRNNTNRVIKLSDLFNLYLVSKEHLHSSWSQRKCMMTFLKKASFYFIRKLKLIRHLTGTHFAVFKERKEET